MYKLIVLIALVFVLTDVHAVTPSIVQRHSSQKTPLGLHPEHCGCPACPCRTQCGCSICPCGGFPKAQGGTPAGIEGIHTTWSPTSWTDGAACGCSVCPCPPKAKHGTPTGLGESHLPPTSTCPPNTSSPCQTPPPAAPAAAKPQAKPKAGAKIPAPPKPSASSAKKNATASH